MTTVMANIFEILNPQSIRAEVDLFDIRPLPADSTERHWLLRMLARWVAFEKKTDIAVPYDMTAIAVPSRLVTESEIRIPIGEGKKAEEKILTCRQGNVTVLPNTSQHKKVLKDFLHEKARRDLSRLRDVWRRSTTEYFYAEPFADNGVAKTHSVFADKPVDVFRGFNFHFEVFGPQRIFLVLDIQTSFVSQKTLADFLPVSRIKRLIEEQDPFAENGGKRSFIEDRGGKKKRRVILEDYSSGLKIGEYPSGATTFDELIHDEPTLRGKLRRDDPLAVVKWGREQPNRNTALRLLRPILHNSEINPSTFNLCKIAPEERLRGMKEAVRFLNNVVFFGEIIQVAGTPETPEWATSVRIDLPPITFGKGVKAVRDPSGWPAFRGNGLKQFGVAQPTVIKNLMVLYPSDATTQSEQLASKFLRCCREIGQNFPSPKLKGYRDRQKAIAEIKTLEGTEAQPDLFLILLPKYDQDLYNYFHRELQHMPIQCAILRENQRDIDKFLVKLAVGAIGKAPPGKPWTLGRDLNFDLHIGVDVGGTPQDRVFTACFCFCMGRHAEILIPHQGEAQSRETIKAEVFERILVECLEEAARKGIKPTSLILHRDGQLSEEEQEGLTKAVHTLIDKGTLPSTAPCAWIDVKKGENPYRLFETESGELQNPWKGQAVILDDRSAIIATTGKPWNVGGSVDPLLLTVNPIQGEAPIHKIIADVSDLTEMNWAEPWNHTKLPVCLHLADTMAERITNGVVVTGLPF